jgi:uncharacterized membrane protein SpoIIM required for sporulation
VRSGVVHFSREELLGRELDILNLRWGWSVFKDSFIGQARTLTQWYRLLFTQTVPRARLPLLLSAGALLVGIAVGASQARVFVLPPDVFQTQDLEQGFVSGLEAMRFFSPAGIGVVWFHNLRAVLLATVLGLFSFGVLGIIVLMLPLMLVGYFMASVVVTGISPLVFLAAFILPHGILEIPAIALMGGMILRLGATLASPAPGLTIGEAVLRSLGEWARVLLGLVVPLLLGAALLEVLVTPRIAVYLLGG